MIIKVIIYQNYETIWEKSSYAYLRRPFFNDYYYISIALKEEKKDKITSREWWLF